MDKIFKLLKEIDNNGILLLYTDIPWYKYGEKTDIKFDDEKSIITYADKHPCITVATKENAIDKPNYISKVFLNKYYNLYDKPTSINVIGFNYDPKKYKYDLSISETKNIDLKYHISTTYDMYYDMRVDKPVYKHYNILNIKAPCINENYQIQNMPTSIIPLIKGNFEDSQFIELKNILKWISFNQNRISKLYIKFLLNAELKLRYSFLPRSLPKKIDITISGDVPKITGTVKKTQIQYKYEILPSYISEIMNLIYSAIITEDKQQIYRVNKILPKILPLNDYIYIKYDNKNYNIICPHYIAELRHHNTNMYTNVQKGICNICGEPLQLTYKTEKDFKVIDNEKFIQLEDIKTILARKVFSNISFKSNFVNIIYNTFEEYNKKVTENILNTEINKQMIDIKKKYTYIVSVYSAMLIYTNNNENIAIDCYKYINGQKYNYNIVNNITDMQNILYNVFNFGLTNEQQQYFLKATKQFKILNVKTLKINIAINALKFIPWIRYNKTQKINNKEIPNILIESDYDIVKLNQFINSSIQTLNTYSADIPNIKSLDYNIIKQIYKNITSRKKQKDDIFIEWVSTFCPVLSKNKEWKKHSGVPCKHCQYKGKITDSYYNTYYFNINSALKQPDDTDIIECQYKDKQISLPTKHKPLESQYFKLLSNQDFKFIYDLTYYNTSFNNYINSYYTTHSVEDTRKEILNQLPYFIDNKDLNMIIKKINLFKNKNINISSDMDISSEFNIKDYDYIEFSEY